MTALVELILSLVDLIKAELERSKQSLSQFLLAIALLLGGVLFLFIAIALGLIAMYLALGLVLVEPLAVLFTALVSLVIAGCLMWIGKLYLKR